MTHKSKKDKTLETNAIRIKNIILKEKNKYKLRLVAMFDIAIVYVNINVW